MKTVSIYQRQEPLFSCYARCECGAEILQYVKDNYGYSEEFKSSLKIVHYLNIFRDYTKNRCVYKDNCFYFSSSKDVESFASILISFSKEDESFVQKKVLDHFIGENDEFLVMSLHMGSLILSKFKNKETYEKFSKSKRPRNSLITWEILFPREVANSFGATILSAL